MNRNRRTVFFRIMATIMCAACVVVMCSGYQARAESSRVLSAYNLRELNSAIEQAKEGDIIQIRGEIDISSDLKIPKERITIQRTSEKDRLITSMGLEIHFQNIIFDGGGIKSTYPILIVQDNSTIENCIFKNCGDPNFSGGIGSIGGAVQLNNGNVIFRECDFAENRAYVGGHVLIGENVIASFFGCTMKNGYAGSGGAISVAANASCFLEECTITKNSSMDYGGGIANGGYTEISKSKVFNNNTVNGGADIATKIGGTTILEDSIEMLQELFESENVVVHGWVCDYNFDEGIFIPDVEPTTENLLKLDFEYKEQPTTPDETEPTEPENPDNPDNPDTPTEPENPENPDQPNIPTEPGENEPPKDEPGTGTDKPAEGENKPSESETLPDNTQNKGDEQPPADNPEEKPGVSGSGNTPAIPSDSTGNNSGNNTSNATTTTTTDNRTTDNSDNSRYSSTSDSNNTSTVNNYYQQEKQPSSSGESVQTIVVPVGNTGNGEPLQQTIRVESPEGSAATGSLEGLTLNINVNTASQDQAANTSPVQQSGISWYQAIVLCLLSAILICLLKRR